MRLGLSNGIDCMCPFRAVKTYEALNAYHAPFPLYPPTSLVAEVGCNSLRNGRIWQYIQERLSGNLMYRQSVWFGKLIRMGMERSPKRSF